MPQPTAPPSSKPARPPERRTPPQISPPSGDRIKTWADVYLAFEEQMRRKDYSFRTLRCYQGWIRRFAAFLGEHPPSEIQDVDARAFLSHLAMQSKVGAKTQNQALHALVFLFRRLLGRPIDHLKGVERSPEKRRLPQVISREQVRSLLEHMDGLPALMARLCYGCGLRLEECLSLRVKDVDLERRLLTVRQGKGNKDRAAPLPRSVVEPLRSQLHAVAELHRRDLAAGLGAVELPGALDRKLPGAARDPSWQWIFPATRVVLYPDGVTRRPHLHPSVLQRAITAARKSAQLNVRVTVHTLRHCFATHLLEDGVNIRRLQELLGHSSLQTTMIYTHVRVQPLEAIDFSPLDRL
jgi:integron integrase